MVLSRYAYDIEIPRLLALSTAFCMMTPGAALAAGGHAHSAHASGHAPIGVTGDHLHERGEWMASYRYRRMDMEGIRQQRRQSDGRESYQCAIPALEMLRCRTGLTKTRRVKLIELWYQVVAINFQTIGAANNYWRR